MSYKTRDGKTHQSTVLMGDNGLPIDGIATISGSYVFIEGTEALVYTPAGAVVTLPVGSDLSPVTTAKARYTGRYVLVTANNQIYYINRQSIDVGARTFQISRSDTSQINPVAIDLSIGWQVAEADIVNRMATTSSAKIDSIEFRDMNFQLQLDGDPVTIRGTTSGNTLEPHADGTISTRMLDENGNPFTDSNYLPMGQLTHDNLNLNANLQQNNTDISITNPLNTTDIINLGGGVQSALTVGTTPVEVKVGALPLSDRKVVTLYNNSNDTMYWGWSSGTLTTLTGTPIVKRQMMIWSIGPNQSVFVVAGTSGNNSRISEA